MLALRAACLVMVLNLAFAADAAQLETAQPLWTKDQNGCLHWNPKPQPNESIAWTGGCRNGKATGQGERLWFSNGFLTMHDKTIPLDKGKRGTGPYQQVNYDEKGVFQSDCTGALVKGKWHGPFNCSHGNGDKYIGNYRNGKRHGEGQYFWASGDKFRGEYRDGKKWTGLYIHAISGKWLPIIAGRWAHSGKSANKSE